MRSTPLLSRRPAFAGLLALTLWLLSPASPAQEVINPGAKPEFAFFEPIVNGRGSASLADMQGKLVWVEFWGTH